MIVGQPTIKHPYNLVTARFTQAISGRQVAALLQQAVTGWSTADSGNLNFAAIRLQPADFYMMLGLWSDCSSGNVQLRASLDDPYFIMDVQPRYAAVYVGDTCWETSCAHEPYDETAVLQKLTEIASRLRDLALEAITTGKFPEFRLPAMAT